MQRPNAGSSVTRGAPVLPELHIRATRLILELDGLVHPELCVQPSAAGSDLELQQRKLSELRAMLQQMEGLIDSERSTQKRAVWRKKVESLDQRCRSLGNSLAQRRQRVSQRALEEQQRAELLGYGHGDRSVRAGIESYAEEADSLARSDRMTDDMLHLGRSVLGNLGGQRKTLKAAHRKLLDMANVLGLSNQLMRVIERREGSDAVIVYAGMVLTLVFILGMWWWLAYT